VAPARGFADPPPSSPIRGLRIPVVRFSSRWRGGALRVPANFVVHRRPWFRASVGVRRRTHAAATTHLERRANHVRRAVRVLAARRRGPSERPPKPNAAISRVGKPQDGWTSGYLNRYNFPGNSRWLVKTPHVTPIRSQWGFWAYGRGRRMLASRGRLMAILLMAPACSKRKACSTAAIGGDEPRHAPRIARRRVARHVGDDCELRLLRELPCRARGSSQA